MKTITRCLKLTKKSFTNSAGSIKLCLILLAFLGAVTFSSAVTPNAPVDCSSLHASPSCNVEGPLAACLNGGAIMVTITEDFSLGNVSELTVSLPPGAGNTSGGDIISGPTKVSYLGSTLTATVLLAPGTQQGTIFLQVLDTVRYSDGCVMTNGCDKSISIINVTATSSAPAFCTGGTTTVTIDAASQADSIAYILGTGINADTNYTGIFPGLGAGSYSFNIVAITPQALPFTTLFCPFTLPVVLSPSAPPALTCGNTGPLTCTNNSVTLQANSCATTQGTTYSWSGPSYSSSLQCPSATAAGTYTVTATGSGCSSTCTTVVTSNRTPPSLSCSNTGPLPCGEASSVTLQANGCTATSGVTYSWSGPGFSSASQCPSVSASGTYTVTATTTANGCTSTCTTNVGRNSPPALNCSNNGPMTCTQLSVTLSANSCTGTGITYSWTGPDGFTSTAQCPTATDKGVYTVTATSAPGCITTCTTTVDSSCANLWGCTLGFWKNHTSIWDNATDPISACLASTIGTFGTGYSGNGTASSSFASTFGLTSAQMTAVGYSPSMTLLQALNLGGGQFSDFARQCVAALLNGCGLSGHYLYSSAQVITIVHNALISKNYNPITPSFDDDNQNPPDNCPAGGKATKRMANDGIAINENVTINAYPNPFTDMMTIEISPNVNYDNAAVVLYDVSGKMVRSVYTGAISDNQTYHFTIDGSTLAQGVYFYNFRAADENIFGKVVLIK